MLQGCRAAPSRDRNSSKLNDARLGTDSGPSRVLCSRPFSSRRPQSSLFPPLIPLSPRTPPRATGRSWPLPSRSR